MFTASSGLFLIEANSKPPVQPEGIPDYIPSVPLSWSEYEILSMRPYKWKTNTVYIAFNAEDFSEYNIHLEDSVMKLRVEPNLKAESRPYLNPDGPIRFPESCQNDQLNIPYLTALIS